MIQIGLISFAFGVALAARYQFLVLSVATFLGLIGVALYAHSAHLTLMWGVLAGLLFAISLQAGYLSGALLIDLCLPMLKVFKAPAPVSAQRRWR